MSRRVFISYSREDAERAAWLRETLRTFGHEVWLDEVLEGGQPWWEAILGAIQWCDVFVPLLSPRFVSSEACNSELDYAIRLHRPLLPAVGENPVGKRGLRAELSERQWVEIGARNPTAESDIVRAVTLLSPAGPLPNPLPVPPHVPISYTTELREVLARPHLDRESQEWVLAQVEWRDAQGEEPIDLIELLDELGGHQDFLKALDGRRERLRAHVSSRNQPTPPPPRPPQPQPVAAPPPPPASAKKSSSTNWAAIIIGVIVVLIVLGLLVEAAECSATGFC